MQIEEGKFYRTRSGEKRGPAQRRMEPLHYMTGFPWLVGGDRPEHFYTDTGLWTASDICDERDLVAEWTEPALTGAAVQLNTLADLDAQPGDVVGLLDTETPRTFPICRVYHVREDQHLQRAETGASPTRWSMGWDTRPLFFMIHRAQRKDAAPEPTRQSVMVPDGQTPLDDDLDHRYLRVIGEGRKAREDGTSSPYHGLSLEHCLFAMGWVQADLRMALDAREATAKGEPEPNPDHEAEDSRDRLLDGPDWRGHCRVLLKMLRMAIEDARGREVLDMADSFGAVLRDLEAGE